MINIIEVTDENFDEIKGQSFVPHNDEGVVYIKLVALRPETIANDPKGACENGNGVILAGRMEDIQNQINVWFQQIRDEYGS